MRLILALLYFVTILGCSKSNVNKTESQMTLDEKLLKDRTVLLGSPIDDAVATEVIAKLLFLEAQSKEKPITLYINSPGGSATAGIAIIRTVEALQPRIHTHCLGQAHSIAAIILAAGSHGYRSAATNAVISFSRVWSGTPSTPEKQKHLDRLENDLIENTTRLSGMTKEQTSKLFDSSEHIPSQQAIELGIIDHIR